MATRWLSPFSGVARACAHAHIIFTAVSKREAVNENHVLNKVFYQNLEFLTKSYPIYFIFLSSFCPKFNKSFRFFLRKTDVKIKEEGKYECLELREFKKNMLVLKLPPFPSPTGQFKKRGNFKTSMLFIETNPFLYCLSSNSLEGNQNENNCRVSNFYNKVKLLTRLLFLF